MTVHCAAEPPVPIPHLRGVHEGGAPEQGTAAED
jgi:hypothetical protein